MDDLTPFQHGFPLIGGHAENVSLHRDYGNNIVSPLAIIGEDVVLGEGNIIHAFVVIVGKTTIGNNNTFMPFCSIGTEPEHKAFFGKENSGTIIGDNNMFREYVTVNAGCNNSTFVSNDCVFLRGSHVGHDSYVCDKATISCNVLIGGHTLIGQGANLGLGAICHQFSRIGAYAMIGMGSILPKKVNPEPFTVYVGNPAKYLKANEYQLKNFNQDEVFSIVQNYKILVNNLDYGK